MLSEATWIHRAAAVFQGADTPLYIVGGAVRNPLMGLPISDVDVCGPARPETVLAMCEGTEVRAHLRAAHFGTVELHLTQTAMETLAVIAYRQPATKGEVEQIRGVKCDYSIQSLLNKGLIKEVGRKEALGRPILYATTDRFLEHFGLSDIRELPPLPAAEQGAEHLDPGLRA